MKTTMLSPLEALPYFTMEAVKQLSADKAEADETAADKAEADETAADETAAAGSIRTTLYRWIKAGHIIRLKKGVYMTRRFYENHRTHPEFAPMVSAILLPRSYLSLEYILQRSGILTDMTYPVSAITPGQTRIFENILGTFSYRNIKADLYHGFTFSEHLGIPIARATAAKALFDYLYLRPWKGGRLADQNLAEDLRLNLEDFAEKDRNEFSDFVGMSGSRKMDRILKHLEKTIWRP